MKKLYILLSFLMTTSFVWSQQQTVLQPDSISFQMWVRYAYNEYHAYDGAGSLSYNYDGSLSGFYYIIAHPNYEMFWDGDFQYDYLNNLIEYSYVYYGPYLAHYIDEINRFDGNIVNIKRKYHYTPANEWRVREEMNLYYDDNNRIVEDSVFRTTNGPLILNCKNTYDYNDSEIVWTHHVIDSGNTYDTTTTRTTTALSSDGKTSSVNLEIMTDGAFVNYEYSAYHYTNDSVSSVETFRWNGEWTPFSNDIYTRNDEGAIVMAEHKLWGDTDYENYKRTLYEYNEDGYPLNIQFQDYSESDNTWVDGTCYTKTRYDLLRPIYWVADRLFTQEHLQIFDMAIRMNNIFFSRIDFSYIETPYPQYNIVDTNNIPITIHPNPAKDVINIEISSGVSCTCVQIYSLDGRLVKSQRGDTDTVNISCLAAGVYVMKLTMSDGSEFSKKIVKE